MGSNQIIIDSKIVHKFSYKVVKKIMDILCGSILFILFFPVYIIISIIIKLSSEGPILYEWNVIGKNGVPFTSWKFRTMIDNADEIKDSLRQKNEMDGPVFKIRDDPRITNIGRFLRKYSIDELPQLISVLKGDMSLVGPRPTFQDEWERYEDWQKRKLSVIPGMTCLWQVNGRNDINNFDEWVKMDLEYIDNWNLWLDFEILIKTIPAILKGTGI